MLKVGATVWPRDGWWQGTDSGALELKCARQQLPGAQRLTRWKAEAPADLDILMQVPDEIHQPQDSQWGLVGPFRPLEKALRLWERVETAADILDASVLVLQTTSRFTPSERNRRSLAQFFESVDTRRRRVVWMARGVWDLEEVAGLCEELDIEPGVDPLSQAVGEEVGWRYGKVEGLGRSSLSAGDLDRLADWCIWQPEGYCILDTADARHDARALQKRISMLQG